MMKPERLDELFSPCPLRPYGAPMTEDDYHAYPAVNASTLKSATAAEMHHAMTVERSSEDLVFGSLLHAAVLEPWRFAAGEFEKRYRVFDETKTLGTKAADKARQENPGKILITPEMVEHAVALKAVLAGHPVAAQLLKQQGISEASLIGWDAENMVRRKIRVDYLPVMFSPDRRPAYGDFLVDIKTTRAHPGQFLRECYHYGYFLQAAWYLDTHQMLTGHRPRWYHFLVVSKEAPVLVRVMSLENLPPDDPAFPESILGKARKILGLDPGGADRLNMFLSAARRHVADQPQSAEELRRAWPGYEEEEQFIFA